MEDKQQSSHFVVSPHLTFSILASIIREEISMEGEEEQSASYTSTFLESITDERIDAEKMQTLAHTNIRKVLAGYIYRNLERSHRHKYPWDRDTIIAHNMSQRKGANQLLNSYGISKSNKLSDIEAIFWMCHRLAIPPPFLPSHAKCAPSCKNTVKQHFLQHGYHQASCSIGGVTTTRHDRVLEIIAAYLRTTCGLIANTGRYLNKEYNSQKSTDLLITYPGEPDKLPVAVDYTCHCPFLALYRDAAARNVTKHMADQEAKKTRKHEKDRREMNRRFVGVPGTTLGDIGTETFWDLIDSATRNAVTVAQIQGKDAFEINAAKQNMITTIQGDVARYTGTLVHSLSCRATTCRSHDDSHND